MFKNAIVKINVFRNDESIRNSYTGNNSNRGRERRVT